MKCTYWRIRCINKNKRKVWLNNISRNDNIMFETFECWNSFTIFNVLNIDLVLMRQVELKTFKSFVLNSLNVIEE